VKKRPRHGRAAQNLRLDMASRRHSVIRRTGDQSMSQFHPACDGFVTV
jgi:hypothetical protein